jgi:hypothetical protein
MSGVLGAAVAVATATGRLSSIVLRSVHRDGVRERPPASQSVMATAGVLGCSSRVAGGGRLQVDDDARGRECVLFETDGMLTLLVQ